MVNVGLVPRATLGGTGLTGGRTDSESRRMKYGTEFHGFTIVAEALEGDIFERVALGGGNVAWR